MRRYLLSKYVQTDSASIALLDVCRGLWAQPYTGPIYALLLHQWVLVHPEAGTSLIAFHLGGSTRNADYFLLWKTSVQEVVKSD